MADLSLMTRALLGYSLRTPEHRGKWRIVSSLVDTLNLQPEGSFITSRAGRKWALSPQDYAQADLFWFGAKDRWALHHVSRLIPKGATIFDVGANFGYYSIMLADQVSQCFSFEPNPTTFASLETNIRLNALPNICALQLGLSDKVGSSGIQKGEGNSGASYLMDGEGIRTTTLDTFCEDMPKIDFIKIDIEGYEERFLSGAAGTLRRTKPALLIELNPVTLPRAGSSVQRVVGQLEGLGYSLFEIQRDRLIPLSSMPSGEDHVDAIAIPNAR